MNSQLFVFHFNELIEFAYVVEVHDFPLSVMQSPQFIFMPSYSVSVCQSVSRTHENKVR